MKTKTKNSVLNWLKPRNWGIVKVYRDFENFLDWRRKIKEEESNPKSKYNLWKLDKTKLYDIYLVISLDEADSNLPEIVQRTKVLEMLNPLNRYLDDELGFAECLNIEFNQFADDANNPTLSYLIVYRFNFEKFSILWLLKFLVVNSVIVFSIIKFNLIEVIHSWILTFM